MLTIYDRSISTPVSGARDPRSQKRTSQGLLLAELIGYFPKKEHCTVSCYCDGGENAHDSATEAGHAK